jgi:hypothetical protein
VEELGGEREREREREREGQAQTNNAFATSKSMCDCHSPSIKILMYYIAMRRDRSVYYVTNLQHVLIVSENPSANNEHV